MGADTPNCYGGSRVKMAKRRNKQGRKYLNLIAMQHKEPMFQRDIWETFKAHMRKNLFVDKKFFHFEVLGYFASIT